MITKTQNESFSLTPRNLEEAMKYSDMLARSTIVPKNYQGKAGDILVAVQMGNELGLKPIQSLQNIAVINGKPCIYGDACMALVKIHPEFEDVKEHFDEKLQAAVCEIKRKGQTLHTSIFTIEDAKKAGLWNKPGPWTQYSKRMLQMRARGFALRDAFPDALQGLILAEEAQDIKDVTPDGSIGENKSYNSTTDKLIDRLSINTSVETPSEPTIETAPQRIETIEVAEITPPETSAAEHLSVLIMKYNVPSDIVDKWLKHANVKKINELPEEALQKCIDYINVNFG